MTTLAEISFSLGMAYDTALAGGNKEVANDLLKTITILDVLRDTVIFTIAEFDRQGKFDTNVDGTD